jgi:hypothetical protein
MGEPGRPPRASVRRPPGEGSALERSSAPASGWRWRLANSECPGRTSSIWHTPARRGTARSWCGLGPATSDSHGPRRRYWRSRTSRSWRTRHPLPASTGSASSTTTQGRRPGGWGRKAVARGRRSRLLRLSLIGTSRRPSGSRAPGQITGGHGGWSSHGGWHARRWACGASIVREADGSMRALPAAVNAHALR